jgi:glycosyltransferase involved in cell wall biosynthesis
MKLTWIVPDTYGFLVDELEGLAKCIDGIRVLSGMPIPAAVRERLPKVELHFCPERSPWSTSRTRRMLGELTAIHGWRRVIASGWHTRKIAGICEALCELEANAASTVIHSHFAHPGGVGGWLVPGAAQVLTLRGYDILTTGSYGSLWNPFYRGNLLHHYAHRGIITTGSRFSTLRARQMLGSQADIRFIKQGITSPSFQAAQRHSRASLGIPAAARVLVSVGNLVEVKNPRFLLEVFAKLVLAREPGTLHLLLCGDGPLREELQRQAGSLGIAGCVHFLGKLPREELTDIYLLSDLFVHPSLSEGFGNVILEAMLHQLLVVASPVGVAPDVIRHGENGYLALPGDRAEWLQSLGEALERLSAFDEAREENRRTVIGNYSMDHRIAAYLEIYQEAAQNRKRSPAA